MPADLILDRPATLRAGFSVSSKPNPRVTFDFHVMFMFVACIAARDVGLSVGDPHLKNRALHF